MYLPDWHGPAAGMSDSVADRAAATMSQSARFVGRAFRICSRVAEEVEEEGLGEGVELGEGGAALGPQRLRPVQHLRNPPLLRQRRQRDFIRSRINVRVRLTAPACSTNAPTHRRSELAAVDDETIRHRICSYAAAKDVNIRERKSGALTIVCAYRNLYSASVIAERERRRVELHEQTSRSSSSRKSCSICPEISLLRSTLH